MATQNSIEAVIERPAHLFKPGQSGNPGGRPLGLASQIREKTNNGAELVDFMLSVLRGLKDKKQKDQLEACNWLADRGFGKVIQDIGLSGPDGGPVQTESLHIIAQMSREELLALAAPRLEDRDLDHDSLEDKPLEAEATPDSAGPISNGEDSSM